MAIAIAINCVAPTVVSLLLTLGDTALQKANVSFKLADYWINGALDIFNTSSVVLVPLTDDYKYVLDVLSKIKESIKYNKENEYSIDLSEKF